MSRPAVNALASRSRGFTLIEIVVVIVILAILIAMAAALTRGVVAAQKRSVTVTRIQTVDAALIQYVMQQKRLPCPADGRKRTGLDADAGTETGRNASGCTTTQEHGVVPWIALGLSEADASDGWDHRLTYRVFPALAGDKGMDMSWCDPAGTGAATGVFPNTACKSAAAPNDCNSTSVTGLLNCTPPSAFLANKGLEVRRADGVTAVMNPVGSPNTGAAYVVISSGESGGGGYLSSGQLGESAASDSAQELKNYATGLYAGAATYYVDDGINETATSHFDDIVSRPSLLSVVTKAGLGPRSH